MNGADYYAHEFSPDPRPPRNAPTVTERSEDSERSERSVPARFLRPHFPFPRSIPGLARVRVAAVGEGVTIHPAEFTPDEWDLLYLTALRRSQERAE